MTTLYDRVLGFIISRSLVEIVLGLLSMAHGWAIMHSPNNPAVMWSTEFQAIMPTHWLYSLVIGGLALALHGLFMPDRQLIGVLLLFPLLLNHFAVVDYGVTRPLVTGTEIDSFAISRSIQLILLVGMSYIGNQVTRYTITRWALDKDIIKSQQQDIANQKADIARLTDMITELKSHVPDTN